MFRRWVSIGNRYVGLLLATFIFDLFHAIENFAVSIAAVRRSWLRTMAISIPSSQLPPNLREVCALLAAGLVRLRRRTAEDLARDAALAGGQGESSLHFRPEQSGHAGPSHRRQA
jgi:hypothetical protein